MNISKIFISSWSLLLGIIFFLPFFFLLFIVGFTDPISWKVILASFFSGQDVSQDIAVELIDHLFWLIGILLLIFLGFILFMLASSYSLFLLSRLAHGYIQRKRIPYNHKIYFSKRYILTFIIIFALNILYILIPIIIGICLTFLLYLFLKAGYISGYVFEILSLGLVTIFIGSLLYVGYRVLFGYIILAGDTQESEVKNARFYVAESIRKTSGKVIGKFIVVFIIYAIIIFPFYMLQSIGERKLSNLSSALGYKTISVDTIPEQDMAYYEYVTLEYSDISSDQIVSRIGIFTWISTIYSITLYFLLSGLFVLIMTSFYTRILNK